MVKCLADTGASFSVAPISLTQKINSIPIEQNSGAFSASGHFMSIIGQTTASLSIAGITVDLDLKLVQDSEIHSSKDYELILGCDK